ncbi:MAG: hypothetical protein AAF682_12800 [Planctomycetota bacterium]
MTQLPYDYGDLVRVEVDGRQVRAWICGIRTVANEREAGAVGYPVGTVLYLVDYEAGDSEELPEPRLSPDDPDKANS